MKSNSDGEILDAERAARVIAAALNLTPYEGIRCLSGAMGTPPPPKFNDSPTMYREGALNTWIRKNKSKLMRE